MQSFSDLSLSPEIQRAIQELGFETPSPIQAQTLPILTGEKTDFLGLAGTGTGKTAAFSIPLLERIDATSKKVQALVLCPTRELALQVSGQINLLGKYKGLRSAAVYGGSSFGDQVFALKQNPTIVVGTPGRVIDHLDRGTLALDGVRTLILDEADEMISMGFKDELEAILGRVPREEANTWLFSATMSREVRRVADTYLRAPKQVQINKKEMLSENVEQLYYVTQESNKPEILCKLIDAAEDFYGIIFCQTKALVMDLTDYLNGRGYKVDCLHGDKDQRGRERTMQAFRDRKVQMLVCTDVAARGLDIDELPHVINYELPRTPEDYIHRIGRTGRAGKPGTAISLVSASEVPYLVDIEKLIRLQVEQVIVPGFEPEYDYCYPPGDKRTHHRRPSAPPSAASAPFASARSDRATGRGAQREGSSRSGNGRMAHVAADGFDFSKPYESRDTLPVTAATGSNGGKSLAHSEQPHKPRRPVAALLGGLGRK